MSVNGNERINGFNEYGTRLSDYEIRRRYLRSLPALGLKGKAARIAFGVLSVPSVIAEAVVGSGNTGLLAYTLPFLVGTAQVTANVVSASLVIPCAYVTYRQATGPRFPLLALAWLALTCAMTAVAAWLFAHVPASLFGGCGVEYAGEYYCSGICILAFVNSIFLVESLSYRDPAIGIDWKAVVDS